jgi:hypothetical protein
MSSAIRHQIFPFDAHSVQPAKETNRIDPLIEHRLFCEVVSALAGYELDDAVLGIYRSRPAIVNPTGRDLRSSQLRFLR